MLFQGVRTAALHEPRVGHVRTARTHVQTAIRATVALTLGLIGIGMLALLINPLTALLTFLALIGYVVATVMAEPPRFYNALVVPVTLVLVVVTVSLLANVFLGALAALAAIAGLYLYEYAFVMAPQEIPNS